MNSDLTVNVLPSEDGLMIKEIIYGRLSLSRGLLRRMKKGGGVFLNGDKAYITQRVKKNDVINIIFADSESNVNPELIDINILWEDNSLLVINKPAGIAVYPTRSYPSSTLVNGVAQLWRERGLKRKVRLVHRLDRETSGVILVAKDPYSYQKTVQQLRENHLKRNYLAIISGKLPQKEGYINQPIGRPSVITGHSLQRGVVTNGKPAGTYFKVIKEYSHHSLIQLELTTGRTHQIRVHMSWLGFPIVGDQIYGALSPLISRQALHAWSMEFQHPRKNEIIKVRAPIPHDMLKIIQERRSFCANN